ncbi:hypothetical protein GCM10011391_09080 [Pullulanibacillus camelliae]|uniref:Uncharacterized protein n=1 Tax=Pullulanibacillus camelliae TaxID=1707096 RepID=A0A8J2VJR1_9BACL|nr:hypothetical protein GCM10011391_09080 [Pullulanibacillus camelliae]
MMMIAVTTITISTYIKSFEAKWSIAAKQSNHNVTSNERDIYVLLCCSFFASLSTL